MNNTHFQIVKKTAFPVLLNKNVCYSPLFEALFWKSTFSRPPLIQAYQDFLDDTYFGGMDEPP